MIVYVVVGNGFVYWCCNWCGLVIVWFVMCLKLYFVCECIIDYEVSFCDEVCSFVGKKYCVISYFLWCVYVVGWV